MEPNKILSASLIDVIFDGRNKEYGAYELRKNDPQRTKAALSFTIAIAALVLAGVTMANSSKKKEIRYKIIPDIELANIKKEKPPEKLPEKKKPVVEQPRTQKFTQVVIVNKKNIVPPPATDDLDSAIIDVTTRHGKPDNHFTDPPPEATGDSTGIIQPKKEKEAEVIRTTVDVPAKFIGNWKSFLERNLNAETPVNHGASPGRYSVVVQFVVDNEGNVSDIKALTNHGYGVEEEAMRVLKKAPKWKPAIEAGQIVKAYHKQVIVFEVVEE